jgi:DNA mismatch endonuclease (patch repair protein)
LPGFELIPQKPTPAASSPAALARMKAAKRRDTTPELRVRRALHRLGFRFYVDRRPLTSSPKRADILFSRQRVAIFIDGCYWHGCPEHGTLPKANADWWAEKITGNARRDRATETELRIQGWRVIRIWEHEETNAAVARILLDLRPRIGRSPLRLKSLGRPDPSLR